MKKVSKVRNWTLKVSNSDEIISELESTRKLYNELIESSVSDQIYGVGPIKKRLKNVDGYDSANELISSLNEINAILHVRKEDEEENKELQYQV